MTNDAQATQPSYRGGANEPTAPAGVAAAGRRHRRTGEVVCSAADVPAEAVRWLWKDHFAIGKISLVAGTANVGKSLPAAGDFASRLWRSPSRRRRRRRRDEVDEVT